MMSMDLVMRPCLRQDCTVCEQPIDRSELFDARPKGEGVSDLDVFLWQVALGLCPACGTSVTHIGQTPDLVIERYVERLKTRKRRKNRRS